MPGNTRLDFISVHAELYMTPCEIPGAVMSKLLSDSGSANTVLPFIQSIRANGGSRPKEKVPGQFWIGVWSTRKDTYDKSFDFLLSCTNGPLGSYPIFIYSAYPCEELSNDFLASRMKCLVSKLLSSSCTERVFSVFAPSAVTEAFCNIWTSVTDIARIPAPYYRAKFACCYRYSLKSKAVQLPENWRTRLATLDDLQDTGRLCEGFAATSEPFTLSRPDALREAIALTVKQKLWVLEVPGAPHIASIVAVTRETATMSAVTKVFTDPQSRGLGCAEHLVRAVCFEIFENRNKEFICLYVGYGNPARRVYDKVGFLGLSQTDHHDSLSSADDWLEVGFDRSRVQLGHW